MAKKPQIPTKPPSKKKKGLRPVRRAWTVVMIIAILGLTFFVYRAFGIGDGSVWVRDILTLVLLMVLVFLAAGIFVWILTLIRKTRSQ